LRCSFGNFQLDSTLNWVRNKTEFTQKMFFNNLTLCNIEHIGILKRDFVLYYIN
jgi:hypothetical protein